MSKKIRDSARVRVAIIGCGLIGAQWDDPGASQAFSLTHAAAFSKHPSSMLVAVCDFDLAKAEQAADRWGCKQAYSDPAKMFAEVEIDLVVIAASSSARMAVLTPALAAGIAAFVIEKPLANSLAESRQLVDAIHAAGARTLVNFSRHWDPSMRDMQERIAAGAFGKIQRLVGLYGKGISNNGSHMIDLVSFLCQASPLKVRSLGSPLDEAESAWSDGNDRALDAQIVFAGPDGRQIQLDMLGNDQSAFTCFELKIIGTEALADIAQGGRRISWSALQPDPNYNGYTIPEKPRDLPAHATEAMDGMAHEAVQLALCQIDQSSCDVDAALRTAMTVQAIKTSAAENGRWVAIDSIVDSTMDSMLDSTLDSVI